ncbi:hypothetical protein DL98DRAFT_278012 [Cadophora sp. DSE1049]|nr:hypothetical protein DL98DRAFT_278012 [Cadophora sp. DSE1049]
MHRPFPLKDECETHTHLHAWRVFFLTDSSLPSIHKMNIQYHKPTPLSLSHTHTHPISNQHPDFTQAKVAFSRLHMPTPCVFPTSSHLR